MNILCFALSVRSAYATKLEQCHRRIGHTCFVLISDMIIKTRDYKDEWTRSTVNKIYNDLIIILWWKFYKKYKE
jgi:hypothetical protein